jgi:hypothetical protein
VNYVCSQYDHIELEGFIILVLRNVEEQGLKFHFLDVSETGEVIH